MKKTIRIVVSAALAVAMLFAMTGCTTYNNFKAAFFPGDQVAQEKTIKIGVYESATGKNGSYGKQEIMGIQLANELYGTVLDKKVELIYGDNQSNMYVGETVIEEMIAQSPSVILGSYGETVSLVASDYVKAASIPAITITGTNPLITANNEYYFTATFPETRQGDALAQFTYDVLKKDTVATVKMANDDTATATIKRFTNKVKKLSGSSKSIVGNYILPNDTTDYSEVIELIRSSGAKSVFLDVSPSVAEKFLQQVIDLHMTHVVFLGTRSWNDEKFLKFVSAQEKLEIGYPSDFSQRTSTEMSETFVNAYKQKYGPEAEPAEATAIAFDAYLLAVRAIEDAQTNIMAMDYDKLSKTITNEAELKATKEEIEKSKETGIPSGRQIKAALNNIKDFQGASGIISYDGKNEATKTIVVNHISGGKEMPNYTVD